MIHELEFSDLLLTVHGDYYEGTSATYELPGDREEFNIDKITVGFEPTDITTLCENCMNDIEQLIIDTHYR